MVKVARRDPQPLLRSRPAADGGEGRFNGVSGAQVWPVFGREVIEGKQDFLVLFQTIARFGVLELMVGQEPIVGRQGVLARGARCMSWSISICRQKSGRGFWLVSVVG